MSNIDLKTVEGFGREWTAFRQNALADCERSELFQKYFSLVEFRPQPDKVLDFGCGSGRWSALVAPRAGELIAVDASASALQIARENVTASNVRFVLATPDNLPFAEQYFDLIFSLGVLHHVPDTAGAIASLARKLRPGGTLLLYLYYRFDNRPFWYRALWRIADIGRRTISRLPFFLRRALSEIIALCIYWPLARLARYLPVPDSWPLRFYAQRSFYVMRTDALDRFGTGLEKRFTKPEIRDMLLAAGLSEIVFSESEPHWVCKAIKVNA